MSKTRLQEMRIKREIRQEEMAKLVEMNQSTYSRKERGVTDMTMEEWKKVAQVLAVEIEDIYHDINKKFPSIKFNTKHLNVPNSIFEELNSLKKENLALKKKLKLLKNILDRDL